MLPNSSTWLWCSSWTLRGKRCRTGHYIRVASYCIRQFSEQVLDLDELLHVFIEHINREPKELLLSFTIRHFDTALGNTYFRPILPTPFCPLSDCFIYNIHVGI